MVGEVWQCNDQTCCTANPTCGQWNQCNADRHLKPDRLTEQCDGAACDESNCCDWNDKCTGTGGFDCSPLFYMSKNGGYSCTYASVQECTAKECCTATPVCLSTYDCPATHHRVTPPPQCAGEDCDDSDCCSMNDTCSSGTVDYIITDCSGLNVLGAKALKGAGDVTCTAKNGETDGTCELTECCAIPESCAVRVACLHSVVHDVLCVCLCLSYFTRLHFLFTILLCLCHTVYN
jgi:hypothetical protein